MQEEAVMIIYGVNIRIHYEQGLSHNLVDLHEQCGKFKLLSILDNTNGSNGIPSVLFYTNWERLFAHSHSDNVCRLLRGGNFVPWNTGLCLNGVHTAEISRSEKTGIYHICFV